MTFCDLSSHLPCWSNVGKQANNEWLMIKQHMQGFWKTLLAQRGTQSTALHFDRLTEKEVTVFGCFCEREKWQGCSHALTNAARICWDDGIIYWFNGMLKMLKTCRSENVMLQRNSGEMENQPTSQSPEKGWNYNSINVFKFSKLLVNLDLYYHSFP